MAVHAKGTTFYPHYIRPGWREPDILPPPSEAIELNPNAADVNWVDDIGLMWVPGRGPQDVLKNYGYGDDFDPLTTSLTGGFLTWEQGQMMRVQWDSTASQRGFACSTSCFDPLRPSTTTWNAVPRYAAVKALPNANPVTVNDMFLLTNPGNGDSYLYLDNVNTYGALTTFDSEIASKSYVNLDSTTYTDPEPFYGVMILETDGAGAETGILQHGKATDGVFASAHDLSENIGDSSSRAVLTANRASTANQDISVGWLLLANDVAVGERDDSDIISDIRALFRPQRQVKHFFMPATEAPKDVVTDKYIVGGTVFGDNDTTNVKMVGPNGQILMTGPATYTAQAVGGNPKINGITSYTSINGVSTFTSINGVT
jgi:hypothetical protein